MTSYSFHFKGRALQTRSITWDQSRCVDDHTRRCFRFRLSDCTMTSSLRAIDSSLNLRHALTYSQGFILINLWLMETWLTSLPLSPVLGSQTKLRQKHTRAYYVSCLPRGNIKAAKEQLSSPELWPSLSSPLNCTTLRGRPIMKDTLTKEDFPDDL